MGASLQAALRYSWGSHRSFLIGTVVVYVLLGSSLVLSQGGAWSPVALAILRSIPLLVPLVVFSAAGSLFSVDFAAEHSAFPRLFWPFPVTASRLVLAFMGLGVLSAAVLWAAGFAVGGDGLLTVGPADVSGRAGMPLALPVVLTSHLVWLQALMWRPFRRRWSRVWCLLAVFSAHVFVLALFVGSGMPAGALIALGVAQLGIAYTIAVRGVARARCGEPAIVAARASPELSLPSELFDSAASAQRWFENVLQERQISLPMVLVVLGALLFVVLGVVAPEFSWSQAPEGNVFGKAAMLLLLVLVYFTLPSGPNFATFRVKPDWSSSKAFAMPQFFAALPFPTGEFAWIKLGRAAYGAALPLFIVVVAAGMIVPFTGVHESWVSLFEQLSATHGVLETTLLAVLVPFAVIGLAAAATANALWLALPGRYWNFATVFLLVSFLGAFYLQAQLTRLGEGGSWLPDALRTFLPPLAAAKVLGMAILVVAVRRAEHYAWARIIGIIGVWGAAVVAVYAVCRHFVPTAALADGVLLALVIVLLPVLGWFLAPLALSWNRCR